MKKTYISPVSKCFAVNTTELIALSMGGDKDPGANSGTTVETKEEKTSGAGMWDLYN